MLNLGIKPGESIQDYVKRLEAHALEQAKMLAEKETKLAWKLSDKGVISVTFGRGFPTSASADRWLAILDSKELKAFVVENSEKAKAMRKDYMTTDEYKTNAAKINAEREKYSQNLKLAK